MKLTKYFITSAICLGVLWLKSCSDPLEEKLFDPANAHFRFEYTEGTPAPTNIPLDTLNLPIADLPLALQVPVAFSSLPVSETSRVRFTASQSGNLSTNEDFRLLEDGQPTDFELSYAPGEHEKVITVELEEGIPAGSFLRLTLTESIPENINLGFPGPRQERKSFTILFEE